jgi:hypothetical protein
MLMHLQEAWAYTAHQVLCNRILLAEIIIIIQSYYYYYYYLWGGTESLGI